MVTIGKQKFGKGHLRLTILRVGKGHFWVDNGHLRVPIGIGQIRITVGHLRVNKGNLSPLKVTWDDIGLRSK